MIWAEAVEAVGDVYDYDAINEYIATHTFEPIKGVPLSFAGGDSDHILELPYSAWAQVQVQGSEFRTLYWKG